MIEFQHRVEIDQSPRQVFALLVDLERMPEWQSSVVTVRQIDEGPVRANTEFEQTWKFFGRERRVPSRVTAWKEEELLAVSGDAGFADFYCGFELAELPSGGTAVTTRAEFRLHGLWKLAQPLLAGELRREMAGELDVFKALVEGEQTAYDPTASALR
jgi:uncharacterized membrane protein